MMAPARRPRPRRGGPRLARRAPRAASTWSSPLDSPAGMTAVGPRSAAGRRAGPGRLGASRRRWPRWAGRWPSRCGAATTSRVRPRASTCCVHRHPRRRDRRGRRRGDTGARPPSSPTWPARSASTCWRPTRAGRRCTRWSSLPDAEVGAARLRPGPGSRSPATRSSPALVEALVADLGGRSFTVADADRAAYHAAAAIASNHLVALLGQVERVAAGVGRAARGLPRPGPGHPRQRGRAGPGRPPSPARSPAATGPPSTATGRRSTGRRAASPTTPWWRRPVGWSTIVGRPSRADAAARAPPAPTRSAGDRRS